MKGYDAIVVGAGPGGCTSAIMMARKGLNVLMIDQATFPREKVCGDAISGKSVTILRKLGLVEKVSKSESLDSWGVIFSGPYGDEVAIPFSNDPNRKDPPGYLSTRQVFDQLLFEEALALGVAIREASLVRDLTWDGKKVTGVVLRNKTGGHQSIKAPLTIGADGAYSVVSKKLGLDQLDEKHYFAAVRGYFEGVTGFHAGNYIELHFVEEALPGYFWIFPLPDGRANIGLGTVSAALKKRKTPLKPMLDELIQHPRFRGRFQHAKRVSPVKGWGLPLGSKPKKMAGNGWMLLGDAASLIDPFTGEGIGNAMVSGDIAATWAEKATGSGNFSQAFLKGYQEETLSVLRPELKLSYAMQRLMAWKWPLNYVIRKASRSPELADTISCMFEDISARGKLASPAFYLRLLFS